MSDASIKAPRKLIEVALPLDAINRAAVRENYIYKGNPSAIHKWWAQRPLAAARAVIFAQLVNDPGYQQGGGFKYGSNKKDAAAERKRLFAIIEELVKWENNNNASLLERARAEIRRSWREVCDLNRSHPEASRLFDPDRLPPLYDPFAGSGAIPLEAQRLGLTVYASDLNPVAVLLNKATIDIPARFAGRRPVSLRTARQGASPELGLEESWPGASGLAQDVRHYGSWMLAEARKRIGHIYPAVLITEHMAAGRADLQAIVGESREPLAWIWARTVKSPNPAFSHVAVPLASNFILSSKPGREAYVQPVVSGDSYSFEIKTGPPPAGAESGTKAAGRGSNFRCLVSDTPISGDYIKSEGQAGRVQTRLMACVIEGPRGRTYVPPTEEMERAARDVDPEWRPAGAIPARLTGGTCVPYGLKEWGDIFTPRQLKGLTTLSDLVGEAWLRVQVDAKASGLVDDDQPDGAGARAYADAVATYLAFAISKTSEYSSSLTVWYPKEDRPKGLFARQAIPMVWDFPEQNILGDIGGSFSKSVTIVAEGLSAIHSAMPGTVFQADAAARVGGDHIRQVLPYISTDPPYYNNIAYADLSDFFYVWLRKSLRGIYPSTFGTIAVPKADELVAAPYRHGSADQAEEFFLDGMTRAMRNLARNAHPEGPVTIYYAFKQSENLAQGDISSTGWATFLEAVIAAGFQITGTWPMRTERQSRSVGIGTNSLASSIVLVCRKRGGGVTSVSRREFIRELNVVLPEALDEMTKGSGDERSPVAPVDLSQAIIGPGMAIFSKHAAVLEADGSPMSVRMALQLINRFLAEDDFDADTQFCLHWFEQHGWAQSVFGEADVLARSKSTSVDAMKEAGVVESGGGKVRLLKWAEYPSDWDPRTDVRLPVWEALHHLIRALRHGGESASGAVLAALGGKAEAVRQLAYRLYTLCERLGQAEDARAYNELITSWTGIESAAAAAPRPADGFLPGLEA